MQELTYSDRKPLWWIPPEAVTNLSSKPVGNGDFGVVYTGRYGGAIVAVKKTLCGTSRSTHTAFHREVELWTSLRYPHILPLYGAFFQDDLGVTVSPFMQNGSIDKYVSQSRVSVEEKLRLMYEVASGMTFLHSKDVTHGDLKPSNVLLDSDFKAVIADFDASGYKRATKLADGTAIFGAPMSGTPAFIAPEIIKQNVPNHNVKPSDVYAYAMLLYLVLKDCDPLWPSSDNEPISSFEVLQRAVTNDRPTRFDGIPENIWALIERCWHQQPEQRPAFVKIETKLQEFRHSGASHADSTTQPTPETLPKKRPRADESYKYPKLVCIDLDSEEITMDTPAPLSGPSLGIPDNQPTEEAAVAPVTQRPDLVNIPEVFKRAWELFSEEKYEAAMNDWQAISDISSDPVMKPISTLMMGWCYYHGFGVDPDIPKGYKLIIESKTDDFNLGVGSIDPSIPVKSASEAAKEFFKLCDSRSAYHWPCKHLTTVCRFNGFGTRRNQRRTFDDFRYLAEKKHAVSQQMLGECYRYGCGAKSDDENAFKWYTKAANQGNATARYNLGVCYENGQGVDKSYSNAFGLYTIAAIQGNVNAQNSLGGCYRNGRGVDQDISKAVEWYTKAANQGHASAQNNLGLVYRDGEYVEQDHNIAFVWFTKAANQGHADAQCSLGLCFKNGWGVDQDPDKAFDLFTKSADQEHAHAKFNLGLCYGAGQGIEASINTSLKWLRKSANQGDALAQRHMGLCYENGTGVKRSIVCAKTWFQKAAAQGDNDAKSRLETLERVSDSDDGISNHPYWRTAQQGDANAQCVIGQAYCAGRGVQRDHTKAVFWFTRAAQQGHTQAQKKMGDCYYRHHNYTDKAYKAAVKWWTKAANRGNQFAQYRLGDCYTSGNGAEKNIDTAQLWYQKAANQGNKDAIKALKELQSQRPMESSGDGIERSEHWEAAQQGDAEAQFNLGVCYEKGRGIIQDYPKAVKWWTSAANQGHANAQYNLGICHSLGIRVARDHTKAFEWFTKAANQGHARAQYGLGFCYEYGKGVSKNIETARSWIQKAADQGHEAAKIVLERLDKVLAPTASPSDVPPMKSQ
ncbi:uncharacterized protein BJ171DRAFT_137570 [Polychytrium aggregatum]|uniref:uncharacterized protein n=1 Tax=Polychytrium aggregatum TaxID=110093 RepID=UPI0022FE9E8D|nr:uncharacterized protein BJ171DRAFT_137570 [Polychytrium aggregatum]KAI9203621.1 hypothetical protein BJ171DRAFT_137570 [Polychytrium aggregatum]